MAEARDRIRILRQVEHGVLSKVENANGIVTLLKELGRDNETAVAVAATHCLRRVFTQLLDPAKNTHLPRPAPANVASPAAAAPGLASDALGEDDDSWGKKKNKTDKKEGKKCAGINAAAAPADDDDRDAPGAVASGAASGSSTGGASGEGTEEAAARVYQAWLEARYLDFLRVLLGWIAEVDDFHRQGPALRTLMQFVEIEPRLCVSAAKLSRAGGRRGGFVRMGRGAGESSKGVGGYGEGTIWGGLFAELVRTIVLGPCSMQPKLLKALGDDYVNVHDDVRYFLLGCVTAMARQAVADDKNLKEEEQKHRPLSSSSPSSSALPPPPPPPGRFILPADSPLRGFQGAAAVFTIRGGGSCGGGGDGKKGATGADVTPHTADAAAAAATDCPLASKKRKRRRKSDQGGQGEEGRRGCGGANAAHTVAAEEEGDEGGRQKMGLAELGGRLARVLMVVRMVEEQSDLTAFLVPVHLSLPSPPSSWSMDSFPTSRHQQGGRPGGDKEELDGDASSSSDGDSSDEEDEGRATGVGKGQGRGGKEGCEGAAAGATVALAAKGTKPRMLAIERLRYHKKAFGDAWLACLRLPLPPALYRRVLLFLPGNVIPYMPSPVRLADFLTAAYGLGGVQSVLALDALFLLMQSHDLEYPDFYDSLYRLVNPDMMYAKYRARFFRMVDLCLSSSHVPAYVVAAFLKRFARTTLQAPPSGALFTLALVRKLIGRHPQCLPLISRKAGPPLSRTGERLLTSAGALSGTTDTEHRPLSSSGGPAGDNSSVTAGETEGGGGAGAEAGFVDEYDPACENTKAAGAMKTSLWELAALQNHYHPTVATLARGFLREADSKQTEGEAFAAPSKLAGVTYQSLFDQEMRRKIGKVPLAFRRPNGLFDDIPEEGGGVFAAVNFSIS